MKAINCFLHLACISVNLIASVLANVPEYLEVQIKSVDFDKVTLSVLKVEHESLVHFPCVLYYYPTSEGTSNERQIPIHPFDDIEFVLTLADLKPGTNYTVLASSSSQATIKLFSFLTDMMTTISSGPQVEYKETQLFSASKLDIVLGVLFGIIALCIIGVTSLYLYRRYQRRRRLQNFLRTPHTDPFESLQDYVE